MDFKETNRYNLIRFETLFKDPIQINKKRIEVTANLNDEYNLNGLYDEMIYLIPASDQYKEKTIVLTLNFDLNTVVNLNVNEDGDCNMEITAMWDIDYSDTDNIEERVIPDIIYDGKKIEDFEKLYERKRWNIMNVKAEKFGNKLFSEKTIAYIKNSKDKNFKYDILINKENKYKFLREKVYDKIEFFNEKEKENFKKQLELLAKKLKQIVKDYNDAKGLNNVDYQKNLLYEFLLDNKNLCTHLTCSFVLYNKRWNLTKFSEDDFQMFLLFSYIQLYFQEGISQAFSREITEKYESLKDTIIKNNSLTLIEKTQIICGFTRFCSSSLFQRDYFPELFIVEKLPEEDPYKMAIQKSQQIINELKESSGYFKKILLFDMAASEIINEWDLEYIEIINFEFIGKGKFMLDKKSSFKEFKNGLKKENELKSPKVKPTKLTFSSLSMLTLKQTKEHSFNLLPKFFFKVGKNYDFNALSDAGYRITFFNETRILCSEDVNDENKLDPNACVLPLMIEISHERFSHLKIRYSNSTCDSPLLNSIADKNRFICPNYYNTESGYVIENLLADNYEDLKFLKFRNIELLPLTDSKYWTDINFNKMRKFLREKHKEKKDKANFIKDFEELAFFDKRYHGDKFDKNIRCFFKLYNP